MDQSGVTHVGLLLLCVSCVLLLTAGYLLWSYYGQRKHVEEALEGSQRRLKVAIEAARIGTWDSNLLTGELVWSDAAESIFVLERGAFEGTREAFYEMMHEDGRDII